MCVLLPLSMHTQVQMFKGLRRGYWIGYPGAGETGGCKPQADAGN